MNSVILNTATRYLLPLMLLFSLFLLLRGHNEPGGGFIGGLVTAAAFALYALAYSVEDAREALRVDPRRFTGIGLVLALGSGTFAMLRGFPFMTGVWDSRTFPIIHHFGTPLIFDIGVYLVVIGVVLTIIFTLAEG